MSFSEKQKFAGRTVDTGTKASDNSSASSPETGEYITYRVRQGDSLWEIARKYPGVSETDLTRLNKITDASKIQPGQLLKIKPIG